MLSRLATSSTSKITLLQAGSYYGPDGIEEYVRFAIFSPYSNSFILHSESGFKSFDGATCVFRLIRVTRNMFTEPAVANAAMDVGYYFNIYYNVAENYIEDIAVGVKVPFLNMFFGTMLNKMTRAPSSARRCKLLALRRGRSSLRRGLPGGNLI